MNGAKKERMPEMSENMAEHQRHFSKQSRWRIDWKVGLKSEFKSGLPTIALLRRLYIFSAGLFAGVLCGAGVGFLGFAPLYGVIFGLVPTWIYLIILSHKTFGRRKHK